MSKHKSHIVLGGDSLELFYLQRDETKFVELWLTKYNQGSIRTKLELLMDLETKYGLFVRLLVDFI